MAQVILPEPRYRHVLSIPKPSKDGREAAARGTDGPKRATFFAGMLPGYVASR
jgi:hypothetical protein